MRGRVAPHPSGHKPIIPTVINRRPTPWSDVDLALLRGLRGVLTDIDDTLTTDGVIPMGVVAALAALRTAGLPVIAVTGRSMAWCLPAAEHVPLAAVVAENGAMALLDGGSATGLRIEYVQSEAERARNTARLQAAAAHVLREVPGATLSRDNGGRVTDIAIDHGEFANLDAEQIARVVALLEAEGLRASVSSIHINAGFGQHSKLSGAVLAVQRVCGRDLLAELPRWIYVGDSTNDELMFATFPISVGVANLMRFAGQLRDWPCFITTHARGRGFIEVAERVLEARESR